MGLGILLILMGTGFLLYFISYVFQILNTPEQMAIFDFLAGYFPQDQEGGSLFFEFHGASEKDYFRMEFSKAFGVFGIIFLVIIGIGTVGAIIKTFIYAGIKLIIPIMFPDYAMKQKDKPFLAHNKNKDYAERL